MELYLNTPSHKMNIILVTDEDSCAAMEFHEGDNRLVVHAGPGLRSVRMFQTPHPSSSASDDEQRPPVPPPEDGAKSECPGSESPREDAEGSGDAPGDRASEGTPTVGYEDSAGGSAAESEEGGETPVGPGPFDEAIAGSRGEEGPPERKRARVDLDPHLEYAVLLQQMAGITKKFSTHAWCHVGGRWYQPGSTIYNIGGKWCKCSHSGSMSCGTCTAFGNVLSVGQNQVRGMTCTCRTNGAVACNSKRSLEQAVEEKPCEANGVLYGAGEHNVNDMDCVCDPNGDMMCVYEEPKQPKGPNDPKEPKEPKAPKGADETKEVSKDMQLRRLLDLLRGEN